MPSMTVAIIAGVVVLAAIAAFAVWRSSRKADTLAYLESTAVSRQWLMEHQGEERS